MGTGDSVIRGAGIECTLPTSDWRSLRVPFDGPLLDSATTGTSLAGSGPNVGDSSTILFTTATSSIFFDAGSSRATRTPWVSLELAFPSSSGVMVGQSKSGGRGKSVGDALGGVGAFQTQCIGNVGDREEERKSSGHFPVFSYIIPITQALACGAFALPSAAAATMLRARVATACRVHRSLPLHHARHASSLKLNSAGSEDIAYFSKILPPTSIISSLSSTPAAADELDQFNSDWIGRFKGYSTTVLKPKTTREVSQIVKWCNDRRIGICPQGGNTGLVGGSVPVKDEVILNLANMNKVRSFDPISGHYISPLIMSSF